MPRMLLIAALTGLAAAASAQTVPAPEPAAKAAATPAAPAEKPVCRRMESPTGSIMGGRRVCHTRAEWDRISAADHRDLEQVRPPASFN